MNQDELLEKERAEFKRLWNEGKFNYGAKVGEDINPTRIWNLFVVPYITSYADKRVEAERKRVVEFISHNRTGTSYPAGGPYDDPKTAVLSGITEQTLLDALSPTSTSDNQTEV